jgi:hypothetical protein
MFANGEGTVTAEVDTPGICTDVQKYVRNGIVANEKVYFVGCRNDVFFGILLSIVSVVICYSN